VEEQPSPVSAPPRRLLRSRDDRMVAGVCGGLAEYTGIDPVVFRIVFAVAAIAGGSGLIAYLIAWVVIPERRDDGSEPPPRSYAGADNVAAVVIGVIGLLLLLRILGDRGGPFDGDGGLLLLLLVGGGVWWWVRQERGPAPQAPVRPGAGVEHDPLVGAAPAPVPPAPRPPRSSLPLVGVSALLLLWGGMLVADLAGIDVDHQVAIGLSLALVGVVVAVGARHGRPGGLIVIGVLLTVAGAFASVVDTPADGGFGERRWVASEPDELRSSYRLAGGEAVLDLGDLELRGERVEVEVSVWAGELLVIVPADVDVVVEGRVGAGELTVFGRTEDGVSVERTVRDDDRSGAALHVDARVGFGELEVRRAAA
jgi:phage shock protein PspC (stress-responsive transcriptional regulator)